MRLAPGENVAGRGRLWRVWNSGDFTGEDRPCARMTVQKARIHHPRTGKGRWGMIHFNQVNSPVEVPNIMSIDIDDPPDADAASATIKLLNVKPVTFGSAIDVTTGEVDAPGWYTFNRGDDKTYNRFHQTINRWHNLLVENRVVRTYQGYGFNRDLPPHLDENLVITGTWMIDDVIIGADKIITLKCRDLGKPLIESLCFPPVIPHKAYPVSFAPRPKAKRENVVTQREGNVALRPAWSSNRRWVASGVVHGHTERHGFDGQSNTYWMSIGNADPGASYAYEFIEADARKARVSGVEFNPWRGNYVVYVGIRVNGKWLGKDVVPYGGYAGGSNGADEKYVLKTTCGTGLTRIKLPTTYKNVERVRLTFHNLAPSGIGPFPYRAGVREFRAFYSESRTVRRTIEPELSNDHTYYDDYTDIVKYACAVGGQYWPVGADVVLAKNFAPGFTYEDFPDGYEWRFPFGPGKRDPVVGRGAVYGIFESTGTNGPQALTADLFDKKPLMDMIRYVQEIVGYLFFMDPEGTPVWRTPNIWKLGNFIDRGAQEGRKRTTFIPVIHERHQLEDLTVTLADRNNRKYNVVASADGTKGAVRPGREPHSMGLERVGLYVDQNFKTTAECRVMADMIGQRQLFSYRTDEVQAPANPLIGKDDQVRVVERVTAEVYVHYIRGYSTHFDNMEGVYEMTLATHWLGERPGKRWAIDREKFAKETKRWLRTIGAGA